MLCARDPIQAPLLAMHWLFLVAATLGAASVYAQEIVGSSVSYSNGLLAVTATIKGDGALGLRDDGADTISASIEAGALWVNDTSAGGSGWGVRFGSDSKATRPTAVVLLRESVYVTALIDDRTPILYKYDAKTRARVYSRAFANTYLGPMSLMVGRARPGSCDELVVMLTIAKGSSILPESKRDRPGVGYWILDACTGNPSQDIVILEGVPDASGVVSQEIPMDLALAPGGEAGYFLLLEGRRSAVVTNSVAAVHRIDFVSSANTVAFMPVSDVVNARVHAEADCVLVAVDSHPAFNGGSAQKDQVKVFRRDPETLETLEWGSEKKTSSIDPAFTVTLPRRDASQFTKPVDVGFAKDSRQVVLLISTFETGSTWNNIPSTVPSSAPAVRAAIQPVARQSTEKSARPILLFVKEDATIARRVDELRNPAIASPVLPQVPYLPPSNTNARIFMARMALDNDNGRAYIVGTQEEGATKNLLSIELSIGANGSTSSPSPGTKNRVCIGASSTTYEGRLLMDLVARHPNLRRQVHPRRWGAKAYCLLSGVLGRGCEADTVRMLCYSWAPPGKDLSREREPKERGRLCATEGHVLEYNGKLVYMRDFCNWPATDRCEQADEVPWNFKGPCGTHVVLAHDLLLTQHAAGYGSVAAEQVAQAECELRAASRVSWMLRTL